MEGSLILIGGGGHCKSLIDLVEAEGRYKIAGILDGAENLKGAKVFGYPVLGGDELIQELNQKGYSFLISVGQIDEGKIRQKLFNYCQELGCKMPNIVSPKAYVSNRVEMGIGHTIFHGCIINAETVLGNNNIINNQVLIEHEVQIGNHNHISTNSTVNGKVVIGNNNFLGSGSIVVNNIVLGSELILGAGSVVAKSQLEQGTYVGVPAKKINK